jgi:acetolactate synthase-1/2/3 large subunit
MGEMIGIGEVATRMMKEEGIEVGFGVTGFHAESFYAMFPHYGMRCFTGRHEQWGPYAADGYAGASRKIAVCYGTAGPGVTNMMSGIAQAYQNYHPMLCLCGTHGASVDGHGTIQEAYPADFLKTVTKLVYHITTPEVVPYWIRRAIKSARQYPPGPVALVYPHAVVGHVRDSDDYVFTHPRDEIAYPTVTWGDREAVDKAVRMILEAKRPVILAGDGVYWAHAENNLKEFIELTQTPVACRRAARGSISEHHPLGLGAGTRSQFIESADLLVLIGMRDSVTEGHYQPNPVGLYDANTPWIQVSESADDFIDFHRTPLQILGNARAVLQQMTESARDQVKIRKPDRQKLIDEITKARQSWLESIVSKAEADKDKGSITMDSWRGALHQFLEAAGNVTVILDSFTGSYATSDAYRATFPGQSLDSGGWAGVGHGVAMGFGVQLARPGQPVLAIMGDAGIGLGGMEIETCARYKMPVVSIIWNNSAWMSGVYETMYATMAGDNRMQKDIKYHDMFGCLEDVHSELVTRPEQLVPALEKSFNSGKTAVINVLIAKGQLHPWVEYLPASYYRAFGIERAREVLPKSNWEQGLEAVGGIEVLLEHSKATNKYVGL